MLLNFSCSSRPLGRSLPYCAFILPILILSGSLPVPALRQSPLDNEASYRRFLWVTRWDFKSPQDLERICYNAASARFTDLFLQVRGEGTVYFKSSIEPWAWELSGRGVEGTGTNPGWDPLAVAIREAHRRGLRLHAWVNAMPAWNQTENPPSSSNQLFLKHQSWLQVTESGQPMKPNGFYAFLEPGLPEVRDYLGRLVGEMVKNYDVDGVHLDYIRYPLEEEAKHDCCHHPRVIADFKKCCGKSPEEAPEQWKTYRQQQVTATVKSIRESINKARTGVELSSTTMADPVNRANLACQNPCGWIDQGLVDAVVPMVYVHNDMARFANYTQPFLTSNYRSKIWVGIWPRSVNAGFLDQIKASANAKSGGVAVFSYEELFPDHRVSQRALDVYKTFVSKKGNADIAMAPAPKAEIQLASAPAREIQKTVNKLVANAEKSDAARKKASSSSKSKSTASSSSKSSKQVASKSSAKSSSSNSKSIASSADSSKKSSTKSSSSSGSTSKKKSTQVASKAKTSSKGEKKVAQSSKKHEKVTGPVATDTQPVERVSGPVAAN